MQADPNEDMQYDVHSRHTCVGQTSMLHMLVDLQELQRVQEGRLHWAVGPAAYKHWVCPDLTIAVAAAPKMHLDSTPAFHTDVVNIH